MKNIAKLTAAFMLLFAAISCSKNDNNGTDSGQSRMMVKMTDAPADYDSLVIDVQDVMISYSEADEGWVSLSGATKGQFDLLRLTGGLDTLLADATINSGRVNQIRLLLGSNNYIVVDGVKEELQTPSAQQSGLKVKINHDFLEGSTYEVLLDFDVAKSVVETGNGKYILKPVIRAIVNAAGGSIVGTVLPDSVQTDVFAIFGSDSIATLTNDGVFSIQGLTAGSYNIYIRPASGSIFSDTTLNNVTVLNGQTTNIGSITLTP